jgi:acyl-CoA synthetase (NDP forming)
MINDVSILDKTLEIACSDEETDIVLVVLGNSDKAADELVATCIRHHDATDKPFLVAWTGGTGQPRHDLLAAGVPTYTEPARAVAAIGHLARYGAGRLTAATDG